MERAVEGLAGRAEAAARLIESAESIGIELDRDEAERWIAAMSADSIGSVVVDVSVGVHGRRVSSDSVADYVERLIEDVYRYTIEAPNYAEAARRMYNIFRLTGRDSEAAYIRRLFDEPVTALYQVAALLSALGEAADAGDACETDALVGQVDHLIMSAITALDGRAEAETVRRLLRLRDAFSGREDRAGRDGGIVGASSDALHAVNDYFERLIRAVPSIDSYLQSVAATHGVSRVG
jgi:hypothetical protein